jgi:hypothetical protein
MALSQFALKYVSNNKFVVATQKLEKTETENGITETGTGTLRQCPRARCGRRRGCTLRSTPPYRFVRFRNVRVVLFVVLVGNRMSNVEYRISNIAQRQSTRTTTTTNGIGAAVRAVLHVRRSRRVGRRRRRTRHVISRTDNRTPNEHARLVLVPPDFSIVVTFFFFCCADE